MGLQSHKLIHMRNFLRTLFPTVSPVGAFDHPTIQRMGAYLSTIEFIGSAEDLQEEENARVMVVRVMEEDDEKEEKDDVVNVTPEQAENLLRRWIKNELQVNNNTNIRNDHSN